MNKAKYEPPKGSSYIPLPKALENSDNECLKWALLSLLYPDDSHHKNEVSRYMKYAQNLNMEGVVFPTPVSQIPKAEKRFNLAINIYGYTISPKMK